MKRRYTHLGETLVAVPHPRTRLQQPHISPDVTLSLVRDGCQKYKVTGVRSIRGQGKEN
jgi:hypothetical protein